MDLQKNGNLQLAGVEDERKKRIKKKKRGGGGKEKGKEEGGGGGCDSVKKWKGFKKFLRATEQNRSEEEARNKE